MPLADPWATPAGASAHAAASASRGRSASGDRSTASASASSLGRSAYDDLSAPGNLPAYGDASAAGGPSASGPSPVRNQPAIHPHDADSSVAPYPSVGPYTQAPPPGSALEEPQPAPVPAARSASVFDDHRPERSSTAPGVDAANPEHTTLHTDPSPADQTAGENLPSQRPGVRIRRETALEPTPISFHLDDETDVAAAAPVNAPTNAAATDWPPYLQPTSSAGADVDAGGRAGVGAVDAEVGAGGGVGAGAGVAPLSKDEPEWVGLTWDGHDARTGVETRGTDTRSSETLDVTRSIDDRQRRRSAHQATSINSLDWANDDFAESTPPADNQVWDHRPASDESRILEGTESSHMADVIDLTDSGDNRPNRRPRSGRSRSPYPAYGPHGSLDPDER